MAYSLEKLLDVRALREDKARHHLARVKTELAGARMQKEQKHKELVDYRRWRAKEEKRLFGVLKSKQASSHDLLLFNDIADTLRQNQAAKARQLEEAGQAVEKAEENLAEARQHYVAVNRKKIKIEEHKSVWAEAQCRMEEQYEEKEMEMPGRPVRGPLV
jgi:hypothetical protein